MDWEWELRSLGLEWSCSLYDTAFTDYVVPTLSQSLLLGGRLRPLRLRGDGGLGASPILLRTTGAHLASVAIASFYLAQPRELAVWFPLQLQHLSCCCGVEHSPER